MNTVETQRHAEERGRILQALQQNYGRGAVTTSSLIGALDALGYPMMPESMQFSLTYLEDCKYVIVTRASETPGYRRDRPNAVHPDTIVLAKITPRGILLVDGAIEADPGIRF